MKHKVCEWLLALALAGSLLAGAAGPVVGQGPNGPDVTVMVGNIWVTVKAAPVVTPYHMVLRMAPGDPDVARITANGWRLEQVTSFGSLLEYTFSRAPAIFIAPIPAPMLDWRWWALRFSTRS